MGVRAGEVESPHGAWQVLPVHKAVNRSPAAEWFFEKINGGPTGGLVELPGNEEQAIAL
jgi:hypothetical protein